MPVADPRHSSDSPDISSRAIKKQSHIGSGNPLSQEEWDELQATLPRGSQVRGKVISVHRFGVFVDIGLDPRIPVLLEIIHFKIRQHEPGHQISFPKDYPAVGNEIEARILAYSMKPHDIRLTQLSHLEWIHSQWSKKQQPREPGKDQRSTSEA